MESREKRKVVVSVMEGSTMMLQSQMNVSVVLVLFDRLEYLDFGVKTPWWAAFTGHGEAGEIESRGC